MLNFKTKNSQIKLPANQGVANVILIIFGLILSAILIGLFTYTYKKQSSNPKVPPVAISGLPAGCTSTSGFSTITGEPCLKPDPSCGIKVATPSANQTVNEGFIISGTENGCGWGAFEGQAGTVIAFTADGTSISDPIVLAVIGDWMQKTVNFKATLSLNLTPQAGSSGFLLFRNEDPSGENSKIFKVLVKF